MQSFVAGATKGCLEFGHFERADPGKTVGI
jgi:hypothetical protein